MALAIGARLAGARRQGPDDRADRVGVRARRRGGVRAPSAPAGHGKLAARDAYALRTFANYYLTLPALLAALLGFALLARRLFWRAPEIFTTVAIFSFFFFYKIRIASEHFWMARRFLPVILPGALLFAAGGGAQRRARRRGRRRNCFARAIGVAFVLAARRRSTRARPGRSCHHVEYAGSFPGSKRWRPRSAT